MSETTETVDRLARFFKEMCDSLPWVIPLYDLGVIDAFEVSGLGVSRAATADEAAEARGQDDSQFGPKEGDHTIFLTDEGKRALAWATELSR